MEDGRMGGGTVGHGVPAVTARATGACESLAWRSPALPSVASAKDDLHPIPHSTEAAVQTARHLKEWRNDRIGSECLSCL